AFILFPDPWPKKRQQKRRLIQPEFLESLHRICRPGARVRFATDVKSYADEALLRFLRHGGFEWHANTADDWRCPPGDHLTTRYESKQLGDCAPVWFDFVRS
ncbi:MAG TPA: tRNA (guanosine(46)-N7)-methyltransferase TrmB, partial [Hyphomonas atlantica]|nr:tRNA (guanosine(46)-N7)-methyltransferase TrmB [Hyphomonas atlantica]